MFLPDKKWDGMYIWCIKCWDYKRHFFRDPIDIYEVNKVELICKDCKHIQQIGERDFSEIKLYYRNLNKENH